MRLDTVLRFAQTFSPDVLCLQELKLTADLFPHDALAAVFPHRVLFGQKGYNGVAILSKHPLTDLQRGFAAFSDPDARLIAVSVEGIRLYNLYAPNGAPLGSERFRAKLTWYDALQHELQRHLPGSEVAVVGDMNVAPDDRDVWDPAACRNALLCHPDERAAFARLLQGGLGDALREQQPDARIFSWWDYKGRGFERDIGLRIDHVLLSAPLMARCRAVTVHREVRGWPTPSDHAPVSVDLG